jgi:undecaprenyl-diphosphatase
VYFRKDLWDVLSGKDARLLWLIVVGCLPLPVAALVDKKAEYFSNPSEFHAAPLLIAGCLIGFAVLLKVADSIGAKKRPVAKMSYAEAFFVGVGQVIAALFPGASRSGTTMTFGLFSGLTREATVRYSFLISVPTIAAAALYSMVKNHRELLTETGGIAPIIAGIVVSGLVGYAAIKFLMDYVKRKDMDVFFWYRLVAGAVIIAMYFMRG